MPKFSGKSDAYLWFIVHATQFLNSGGRLSFVISSAILFSDYGIPLVRFIGHHFRIRAVVDSMVERWFPDADTNTVLLMLEREEDPDARANNRIRFIRFRRPLGTLLAEPSSANRRGEIETLVEILLTAKGSDDDPRFQANVTLQGLEGGLEIDATGEDESLFEEDDE